MTGNFELYAPNRETTRAHIRNMLEGVLIKPALLSKKIFNDFMENLAAVKVFFPDPVQLEKHLKSKYLDRFNEKVKGHIFRSLWKVALKMDDTKSKEHRTVTNQALVIMLKNDYHELVKKISQEKDYFSDIDANHITHLIELFNQFPKISELMNDTTRMIIENKLSKDADLDALAYYRASSIEDHMNKTEGIPHNSDYDDKYITTSTIGLIYDQAVLEAKKDKANEFLINMFGKSYGYQMADDRYTDLIEPHLKEFSLKELETLVQVVNNNSQVNGRRRARTDNYYIKERILELNKSFSFAKYQNFV